jgi:hypothetical protein
MICQLENFALLQEVGTLCKYADRNGTSLSIQLEKDDGFVADEGDLSMEDIETIMRNHGFRLMTPEAANAYDRKMDATYGIYWRLPEVVDVEEDVPPDLALALGINTDKEELDERWRERAAALLKLSDMLTASAREILNNHTRQNAQPKIDTTRTVAWDEEADYVAENLNACDKTTIHHVHELVAAAVHREEVKDMEAGFTAFTTGKDANNEG